MTFSTELYLRNNIHFCGGGIMRLNSFEIKNYKSIEHIKVPDCHNLTIFVGRNSSGKTSVFEAIKYIVLGYEDQDVLSLREKIHAGVDPFARKEISVRFLFDVPPDCRRDYFMHFLNFQEDLCEKMLQTQLLKKLEIELSISVPGPEVPEDGLDRRVLPKSMRISNSKDELIPITHEIPQVSRNTMPSVNISTFPFTQNPTITTRTTDEIDIELTEKLEKKGRMNASDVFHTTSYLQGRIFSDLRNRIKFFQSIRESQKRIRMAFQIDVGERGNQLVASMDTLFRKDHSRFVDIAKKCMAIFPDIIGIHPDPLPDNQVRILIKKKLLPNEIDLADEGSGIEQLFILIWRIATAENDSIWFIDEPELHLHPGAQKHLYDFFREESEKGKQIFVATHSMVFIYNCRNEEIYLLTDKDGKTQSIHLSDLVSPEESGSIQEIRTIKENIFKALGYDPSFAYEPKRVVVVEGPTDLGIIKAFIKNYTGREPNEREILIMPGNKDAIKSFAPGFVYALMGKDSLIILDNDREDPEQIKKGILRIEEDFRKKVGISDPIISDRNFFIYPKNVSSIEYYLLDAEAIVDALIDVGKIYEAISEKVMEIRRAISSAIKEPRPGIFRAKSFLKRLWEQDSGRKYEEVDDAISIAQKIPGERIEIHPELVQLIKRITE